MISQMLKSTAILLLLSLFLTSSVYADKATTDDTITITSTTEKADIYNQMTIFKDEGKTLTIEDVSTQSYKKKFAKTGKNIPNFGYTDAIYWAKFQLHNTSSLNQWLLEVSYPPIESITLYSANFSGEFSEQELGSKYPFYKREVAHRNHIFNLTIEPDEKKQYFVRIDTSGSMQLPFTIWDPHEFVLKTQGEFAFLGLFYGILIALALYNLFLFFSLGHRSYIYYVFVILSSIFVNLSLNGIAFHILWPESIWWNHRSIVFFINVGGIAAILFAKSFLDIHLYIPKFKWIARVLIGFNALNIIILLLFSYSLALNLLVVTLLLSIFSIIIAAFICLAKGARKARFFLLAWIIFIIGITISMMADAALLPLTTWTKYIVQVTTAMEGILLSFALADKINIMRREKEAAQLEAQKSQAEAVDNLKRTDEIKDEFLTVTSHELRTPLFGIIGISEALRDGVEGNVSKSMEKQLSMIIKSGKRLTKLVDDILDLSKLKHNSLDINIKQVDLFEAVNAVISICKPLVQNKPIQLINNLPNNIESVGADQNRLMQIFYNLIGNAIKYTDKGEIIVSAEANSDKIQIYITDTGKGIPEENLATIFEPFHQGDEQGIGGTGIGLSITKRLVELQGGTLELKSKAGVGSSFNFTLPIFTSDDVIDEESIKTFEEASVTSTPLPAMPITIQGKGNKKILIADDEVVNLQVLINHLSLEGYELHAVTSGEEVLSAIKRERFDLVILDVMMPNLSGYEVTKMLRIEYTLTELPILMLTAKSQLHDKVASFEVGVNDYLAKPCDKEELIARVKTLTTLSQLTRELTSMNRLLEEKVKERTQELEQTNTNLVGVNKELKRAERSRTLLLSSISHELGTPITLIQSYLQAVREGILKDNNPRYLEMIRQKLHVLERLTKDLFELAQMKSGHMSIHLEEIPFNKWISHLTRGLALDLQQSGRTFSSSEVTCGEGIITGDKDRLNQAFSNIVWNAVKHTPPNKGEIHLSADIIHDDVGEWDKKVRIHIIDNGVGIDEEDLPYIFDRFYKTAGKSTDENKEGVGLGLAITKEIILFHNGTINVQSRIGKGTIFTIELPLKLK